VNELYIRSDNVYLSVSFIYLTNSQTVVTCMGYKSLTNSQVLTMKKNKIAVGYYWLSISLNRDSYDYVFFGSNNR
jgi:hypothetical protein